MKKICYTILLSLASLVAFSQGDPEHSGKPDSSAEQLPEVPHHRMMWQWRKGGVYREFIPIDTSVDKIHRFHPIFQKSIANSYLANLPSPYLPDVFIDRAPTQDLVALNAVRAYFYMPADAPEINTTTPFTQLTYFTGGGKGKAENYLDVWHAQNIRSFWNAGMRYNLISGDGRYMNQKSKAYSFTLYTSYEKERLAFSAFLNQNNAHVNENGGITNKEDLTNSDIEPENAPSFLSDMRNTIRNFNFNTLVQYNIGKAKTNFAADSSSNTVTYPFKATLGITIEENFRRFKEGIVDSSFFPNTYFNLGMNTDLSGVTSYRFNGKLIINEHPKYTYLPGLYAGLDYEQRKYKDVYAGGDTLHPFIYSKYNATWLNAGIFNVDTSALFNYDVSARVCLIGDYAGNLAVEGFLRQYTGKSRNAYIHVDGSLEHKAVNHFFDRYAGNHSLWENNFRNIKQINLTGRYINNRLRTEIGVGFNNFIDYVYMDTTGLPNQTSTNLIVLTGWAKQTFRLGHFYFDQSVYVQKSSREEFLSLPLVSLYSHNYYQNVFFKNVLHCVIGVDLYFNTAFYADKYAPDLMTFYNQRVEKTGNYPKLDVYIDFRLKRAGLFIKYEHVNYHISNGEYFTALNYPINPAMLKFGVRWNFFD